MNKQEIFDTVITHLIKQDGHSYSEDAKGCAYRGNSGRKCAIGVLIPDQVYNSSMENKSFYTLIRETRGLPSYFYNPDNKEFLACLQTLHDAHMKSKTLNKQFFSYAKLVAGLNKLNVSKLTELEKKDE